MRPVRIQAYWIFGVIFLAVGAAVAAFAGRKSILLCSADRSATAYCRFESKGLLRTTRLAGNLVNAVTRDETTWGIVAIRELVVVLDGREHVLSFIAADGDQKDAVARRLAALASGPGPPVEYAEDTRPAMWLLGLCAAAGGAAILLSIEVVTVIVNRNARQVTIRGRAWWRRRRETVSFDRIIRVHAEPFTIGRQTSWNVVLDLGRRSVALARTPLFTNASAGETVEQLQRAIT